MKAALVFRQATALGDLRVAVPALGAQPRDAVGAALALAGCEGLMLALQAWVGCELDPSPVEGDTAAPADAVQAAVNDPALAPAGTTLFMPWALLQASAQPPECLRGDALRWAALRFEVELARYERAPLPADAAPGGGVLLLPESFRSPWPVRLLHGGLGIAWPAAWRGPGSAFELDAAPQALPRRPQEPDAQDEPGMWRVVLSAGLPIDLARHLAGDASSVHLDGEAASRALLLGPHGPHGNTPIAHGTVAPALQGNALWIAPTNAAVTTTPAGTTAAVRAEPTSVRADPTSVRTEPVEVPASWT
jgi:acyl dehydratase